LAWTAECTPPACFRAWARGCAWLLLFRFFREVCTRVFKKFDEDNSGYINREEFGKLLVELGEPAKDSDRIFRDWDVDHNGQISLNELIAKLSEIIAKDKDGSTFHRNCCPSGCLDARKEASTPDDSFGAKLFGDVEVGTNQAKKTGSKGKEGEEEEGEEEEEEEEVPDDLKELDPQDQQLRYLNRLH
jgi:hypothetical protein